MEVPLEDTVVGSLPTFSQVWLPGALIVGAGPSGLATAACLHSHGVPCTILEREDCVASLWKKRTYDRLHLHLPKKCCELPLYAFPEDYPTYPTRDQFVHYLDQYASRFHINPIFNKVVESAEFLDHCSMWSVSTSDAVASGDVGSVYMARWLVVASGENAEIAMPTMKGQDDFVGEIIHGSSYRNGEGYQNLNVLVVGCGNTGMELALDLANYKARVSLVVRHPHHVLPRDLFGLGISTFEVISFLKKRFPLWFVDFLIVLASWLTIGNTAKFGIKRPNEGPLELKLKTGKTPVLDVGTVQKVKSGQVKVVPGIDRVTKEGVHFVDGTYKNFDAIIMATGYTSNVHLWLKDDNVFSTNGFLKHPPSNGWKGDRGLYAAGFGGGGLPGCSHDAVHVAEDISKAFKLLTVQKLEET